MAHGVSNDMWLQVGRTALQHAPKMWALAVLTTLLSISISDLVWRKVTNKLALSCWAMGCCVLARDGGWLGFEAALTASCICFAIALVPHVFGLVGAADVKVFAAIGALVGPEAVPSLLLYAALFAGLLGTVALLIGTPNSISRMAVACLNPQGALDRARKRGQTMPLTVAFCSGAYAILWGGPPWLF